MSYVRNCLLVVLAVHLSSCASVDGNRRPLTSNEKIARCVGMVIGGALLGKLIGGDRNGAQAGAAIGGATCVAWLAFNNEADKRRVAETERAALVSGTSQRDTWTDPSGQAKQVTVSLAPETQLQTTNGTPVLCRYVRTTVVAGENVGENEVEYCRNADGEYRPRAEVGV